MSNYFIHEKNDKVGTQGRALEEIYLVGNALVFSFVILTFVTVQLYINLIVNRFNILKRIEVNTELADQSYLSMYVAVLLLNLEANI